MAHGKMKIQMLTHGEQDCLVPDVFQNVMSKLCEYLVGPFTIRTPPKPNSQLELIMKQPAKTTDCFEIVKDTNKSATSIQDLFHNIWLARYPPPQFIVFDNSNGGEFKAEFK
jgi:hypothetical protein